MKFGLIWPMAPDVAGDQIEQLFGARREAPDAQVAADDHDGNVHVAQEVGQIAVHAGELLVTGVQLLVDGVELLIRALQFFLGRASAGPSMRSRGS